MLTFYYSQVKTHNTPCQNECAKAPRERGEQRKSILPTHDSRWCDNQNVLRYVWVAVYIHSVHMDCFISKASYNDQWNSKWIIYYPKYTHVQRTHTHTPQRWEWAGQHEDNLTLTHTHDTRSEVKHISKDEERTCRAIATRKNCHNILTSSDHGNVEY